ncbi:MAG: 30S ribosomal protein S9 [Candidatus Omnitrophica bacterium]|nr:30S ribosomal protein S9 [Candidatus Omnitrophota bacterium]
MNKNTDTTQYNTVGRRKEAIAQVWLTPGEGKIFVNKAPLEKYFLQEIHRIMIKIPLELTDSLEKYDISVRIRGGGFSGQAEALSLAISRALILIDPALRPILKKEGLLRRDPRMKERKKYGQKGARKRFQWTKR